MRRLFIAVWGFAAVASLLVACTPSAGDMSRHALADEIDIVEESFELVLKKSAATATDALSERAFMVLGQDFRVLNDQALEQMPRAPVRGVVASTVVDRNASVVVLVSTRQEAGGGLNYESSYAHTCVELSGVFDSRPGVSIADAACGPELEEKFAGQAWDRFSVGELQRRKR